MDKWGSSFYSGSRSTTFASVIECFRPPKYSSSIISARRTAPNPIRSRISNGFVGYWTFDGRSHRLAQKPKRPPCAATATPASSCPCSTSTAPTPGKMDQALKFDGSTGYVNNTTFSWPTTNKAVTVSMWVRTPVALVVAPARLTSGGRYPTIFQAHIPWIDNILYWDYGSGTSGRLSADFTPYLSKWTARCSHFEWYSFNDDLSEWLTRSFGPIPGQHQHRH